MKKTPDSKLRELLVVALICAQAQGKLSFEQGGQVLERWDELQKERS